MLKLQRSLQGSARERTKAAPPTINWVKSFAHAQKQLNGKPSGITVSRVELVAANLAAGGGVFAESRDESSPKDSWPRPLRPYSSRSKIESIKRCCVALVVVEVAVEDVGNDDAPNAIGLVL